MNRERVAVCRAGGAIRLVGVQAASVGLEGVATLVGQRAAVDASIARSCSKHFPDVIWSVAPQVPSRPFLSTLQRPFHVWPSLFGVSLGPRACTSQAVARALRFAHGIGKSFGRGRRCHLCLVGPNATCGSVLRHRLVSGHVSGRRRFHTCATMCVVCGQVVIRAPGPLTAVRIAQVVESMALVRAKAENRIDEYETVWIGSLLHKGLLVRKRGTD